MAAIEKLDEADAYLYAIMTDPSGLDQAEFLWVDEANEDRCWRAWPFQWLWWRCEEDLQIDSSARSVGKSQSIRARACAFSFVNPGQEMLITAPEGNHLDAITDQIEISMRSSDFLESMIKHEGGKGGINHRPFKVIFQNGAHIFGRIPQRDGKGVLGSHPLWLEMDEAQSYPEKGWVELFETLKQTLSIHHKPIWRAHGVTRGMGDEFDRFCKPDSDWKVHHITAMMRPTWTDDERRKKIAQYGSRENPDYRRNILGKPGDKASPLFVAHRLLACVDMNEDSDYNQKEYCYIRIQGEEVEENSGDILQFLDFPLSHENYPRTWIGADIGFTRDPTEILVFAEQPTNAKGKKGDRAVLKLITRVKLERVNAEQQTDTLLWLVGFYRPRGFAMDKTGLGLPLFQDVQNRARKDKNLKHVLDTIKGYNFSEKILVEFDDSIEVDELYGDVEKEAGIFKMVLEHSTDCVRKLVDEGRIIFPSIDPGGIEIIKQFQAVTWGYDKENIDQYGRRKRYSGGEKHCLDATRMAALAYYQYGIEKLSKVPQFQPVADIFLYS